MNPFRWIAGLVAGLWRFSRRSWVDVGRGLRPGSRASGLFLFLFLIFFLIGLVLVLLGSDLADVDRWLDAQSGWLDALGSLLFRAACGLTLLFCVLYVGSALYDWKGADRPGCGCLIGAVVIGYFAWFGVIG